MILYVLPCVSGLPTVIISRQVRLNRSRVARVTSTPRLRESTPLAVLSLPVRKALSYLVVSLVAKLGRRYSLPV